MWGPGGGCARAGAYRRTPGGRLPAAPGGADKAAPCRTQVDVAPCFPALLRWVVRWWQGTELALAVKFVGAHGTAAWCRVLFNSNEFLYVE